MAPQADPSAKCPRVKEIPQSNETILSQNNPEWAEWLRVGRMARMGAPGRLGTWKKIQLGIGQSGQNASEWAEQPEWGALGGLGLQGSLRRSRGNPERMHRTILRTLRIKKGGIVLLSMLTQAGLTAEGLNPTALVAVADGVLGLSLRTAPAAGCC